MAETERLSEDARVPLTPAQKFLRRLQSVLSAFLRIGSFAIFLLPIFITAFLTLDLPFRAFDFFGPNNDILNPSRWLTAGQMVMLLSFLVLNLASRRYGEGVATWVALTAWVAAAVLLLAGLSYLAPALDETDMPPVRFIVSFVVAWMLAQFVCVSVFDLTRGTEWRRAPLYGNIAGGLAFVIVYFPALYWDTGAPWANWMLFDAVIKTGFAFMSLGPYWLLRRAVRPVPGLGGK